MNQPSLKTCKTPRLLQRYLAVMARHLPVTVGDTVHVLEEGAKYLGVVTKIFEKKGVQFFDVLFEDGDDGCYTAEDFC